MSTAAQILANRKNASHSTGPKTDAGKAASSRNGLKHGCTSAHLLIPGESESEFNDLLAGLIAQYQPATITESMLVEDMAKYYWLAGRAVRMQNFALANLGPFPVPAEMALLIRYQTANQRAYHQSLAALNALRKSRLAETGFASKPVVAPTAKAPCTPPAPLPSLDEIIEMYGKGFAYNYETREFNRMATA